MVMPVSTTTSSSPWSQVTLGLGCPRILTIRMSVVPPFSDRGSFRDLSYSIRGAPGR
jgi:hypothetical protein